MFKGYSAGTITPTGGHQFVNSDFDGTASRYTAGVSTPIFDASWNIGGTIDRNMPALDKMNPSNFGKTQRGYTTTQSVIVPGEE